MSHEIDLKKLALILRQRRGEKGLRETAQEIGGVSASTLSRIEQGKIPDLDTFVRICRWLQVSPTSFMQDVDPSELTDKELSTPEKLVIHLRADRTLSPKVMEALIQMIHLAYKADQQGELKGE